MDNKPSLSQYFSESDAPPASQFFDEIGTMPTDMVQSVYLGESEVKPPQQPTSTNLFTNDMTASFLQMKSPSETVFSNIVPTVSGSTAVPATSLPDPSTFFDNIGPEPAFGSIRSPIQSPTEVVIPAIENLSIKNQQVDKAGDRRRDAWIPDEEAQKALLKAQSSPKGSFTPEREALTMPGLLLEEELADSLQEVSVKYLGVSEAGSRGVLRQEHVSRDENGLRELIRSGYLRAAINLTHTLLDGIGQGAGRLNRPSKHSARSLQLWFTRFILLAKIKRYDVLTKEVEAFGELNKPDLFYQFYPDIYSDRVGSMVPFSLRLLLAELPSHVSNDNEAMDKLYVLLEVINKMLTNLREGKTEDGSATLESEQDKEESIKLWNDRKIRVMHSVANCAISMKQYRHAQSVLTTLASEPGITPKQERALRSALCRLSFQAGQIGPALGYFEEAQEARNHFCPTPDVREYVDLGLIDVARGKYQDAYNNFVKAADQEPTNIMVANNTAVCLLYMGKLKEAITVLQKAINSNPERGLNEKILINLCTLYELESSKTHEKKLNLLRMICKYKSDTIPNVLECLKLN